jgi:CDP-diacylglycerol--serine O-phosphatidyltransferase
LIQSRRKAFSDFPYRLLLRQSQERSFFYKWLGYPGTFRSVNPFISALVPFLIGALALLMVSNIRYYSFKDMAYFKTKPFGSTLIAIALLFIILIEPEFTLFVGTLGYVISGPVYTLALKIRKPVPEETTHPKETPAGPDGRQ